MFFNCRNRAFNACRHLGGGGALYSHLNDASHASSPHSQGGPQGSQNSANNAQNGLISPREDDPILFTTESGIDIKMGLALPSSYSNVLAFGNLAGFPYFTTEENTTTYTWVIIGRSSSVDIDKILSQNFLFSDWQNFVNSYQDIDWVYGDYFFKNNHEELTPAGNAISLDSIANDYIIDKRASFNDLPINDDEIPAGCVLCLSNTIVETGAANNNWDDVNAAKLEGPVGGNQACIMLNSYYVGNLKTTMDNYYKSGALGLTTIKNNIQAVDLTTYGMIGTDWNIYEFSSNVVTSYIFPLASSQYENSFKWNTYLTASEMKLSSNQWLRDGNDASGTRIVVPSYSTFQGVSVSTWGAYATYKMLMQNSSNVTSTPVTETAGYRPAFSLKI